MRQKAVAASALAVVAVVALAFSAGMAFARSHSAGPANVSERMSNVTIVPKSAPRPRVRSLVNTDEARAEHTVRVQLTALAEGNADLAFARLTPSTQNQFGRPQAFLSSVQKNTPPMTKFVGFSFLGVTLQNRDLVKLPVLLTDAAGKGWVATFSVERQPDDAWLVKSCVLRDLVGQPT